MTRSSDPIEYEVRAHDGRAWRFAVDVDRGAAGGAGGAARRGSLPVWTEMEHARCDGCTVKDTHCPAAADLAPLVEALGDVRSVERVDVVARVGGRAVRRETDGQELVRALVGLILATSDCPVLQRMKPLARMHQPFISFEETLFRAVALHLVRAWFDRVDGRTADFGLHELRAHYDEVAAVNRSLAKRLRAAAEQDASVNGIVQLFSVCMLVSDELESSLGTLRALVRAEGATTNTTTNGSAQTAAAAGTG